MVEITKSAIVSHHSKQMLDLVNDIESYPEFLKWCKQGYIEKQFTNGYVAGMVINIKGIQVEFKTKNHIVDNKDSISMFMMLESGPFKEMSGQWYFKQFSELGSKVELQLQYEIKSKLLGKIFTKGFDQIASRLVNDFVRRAGDVYANH